MTINYEDDNDKMYVSGQVQDEKGNNIGNYDRHIDLKNNSAYSAYFKLNKSVQGGGIGKKLLASNIAMYGKMGIQSGQGQRQHRRRRLRLGEIRLCADASIVE
jgi:hypothetical protein